MPNPFLSDPKSRLQSWKRLRETLQAQSNAVDQIDMCVQFFKQAGFENYYLDWDKHSDWPGAWDLIWNNNFCPSSLSLAVAYTLLLAAPGTFENLSLRLILDRTNSIQKIIVDWDDWWINYNYLDRTDKNKLKTSVTLNQWIYQNKSWQQQ